MPDHARRADDNQLPAVPPSLFSLLSPALGHDFLESLVAHLTTIEHADYALGGMVVGPERDRIATLAVSHRGKPIPNFEYELRGTPCAEVVGLDVCFFDSGLRQRFPPGRVIDGVSGILNQLTGETFGFLANGARNEERDASVQAWTLYAHYQLAAAGAARGAAEPTRGR